MKPVRSSNVRRILFVRPRFLGDVCLTLPAVDAALAACPGARAAYVTEAGLAQPFEDAMAVSAALYDALAPALPEQAPYAVSLAYRVRFAVQMNAREAMHMLELRTSPQGHPAYRRVCQEMHRLIADEAGHRAVAAAMRHVDHTTYELERLTAERAAEQRRAAPRS